MTGGSQALTFSHPPLRPGATMATTSQLNPAALIRAALWIGVLMFGAVAWFMHQRGTFPVRPQPHALNLSQLWLSVMAVVVALMLRRRAIEGPDAQTRSTWTIQLWALGEGAALFGGVLYLLSNEPQWYGLGLLAMATVFVLVPLPRQA